jgi:hypothetical protein
MSFEILHENTVLSSKKSAADPDRKTVISGQVAKMSDGRLLTRSMKFDSFGNPQFSYGQWDQERQQATGFGSTREDAADFKAKWDKLEFTHGFHRLPPQAPPGEINRFCEAWPEVSALLGVRPAGPVQHLFASGPICYPKVLNTATARKVFDLHISGDFGSYFYDPTHKLTDEQVWLSGHKDTPIDIRNACAIQSRQGVVTSNHDGVTVTTLLAGEHTKTLIFSEYTLNGNR